jgi:hypothetical protein
MSVPNHIQSPLVPLDELRDLVADHLEILVTTVRDLPQHHATVANLVHQFERHLIVLVATVQTYTTLQQTILHDLHDIVPEAYSTATAHVVYPTLPLPPAPFHPLPNLPSSTSQGRFAFYAVRRGRTTGIYTSWPLCRAQVSGYPNNQYKGFHTEQEALTYLQQ